MSDSMAICRPDLLLDVLKTTPSSRSCDFRLFLTIMSHSTGKPYVRLARPEEFDQIIELGTKAFVGDPVLSYFANLKEVSMSSSS